jgi:catechol 2,3-dioxygenase-like lactoylglutathione lyase family enzyme
VTRDLEATRKFYEDVIGLPLMATWCEKDVLFGAERTYCHLFFGLGDGGALAFFQFADQKDQEQFGPKMPFTPFHHIALYVDQETQAE